MALQSTTKILVNGLEITSFKFLELRQGIKSHHNLELICRMDVLENSDDELATSSKQFLGEKITLQTTPSEGFGGSYGELKFKGIVTGVQVIKGHEVSSGDEILITAQSPSFISDDGSHFASHNDVSLSEIINKSFEGYDTSKLKIDVRPQNNPTLHYSVQHDESAYDYAGRMAAQFGEWLYYDGEKLIFGTPDTDEVELTYGFDLKEYQLSLLPQSNNYKFFSKDYLSDEVLEKPIADIDAGLSSYGAFVSEKSSKIFSKETKVWHNLYNDPETQKRLDSVAELQKKSIEVKQVKVNGVCDNPGVKLGAIVVIEGGRYRITNITHTNNEIGDYINRFEGITADIDVYPYTNINAFPKAESQVALVKENADPDGLGRIRVQFPWQAEENELTPWLRIVTPHGGGDKGFHFIPEVDEEVLIGFEGGNAEKPYVMGSLYNGNAKPESWKTETNDVKAIRTRTGHTILLSDEDGKESITISDKNTNIIHFDTVEKTLTISSEEKLFLRSKYIALFGDDVEIHSKSTKLVSQDESVLQTGGSNFAVLPDTITSGADTVEINGKKEANIVGQKITTNSKGETLISGTLVKLNS